MTLTQAELIANNPVDFSHEQCREALARLQTPTVVARMRNVKNERTLDRWHDRVMRLQDALDADALADEARNMDWR